MTRIGIAILMAITGLATANSQDTALPGVDKSEKVRKVRFVPPSDLIDLETVEIAGIEEFHRLKIPRLQAAKEKVFGIPIKNITDKPLVIANIGLACGCMAAMSNERKIGPGKTTTVYLRVTPKEVGRFAQRMKISFENETSITCVVESIVHSAFEVRPNTILLDPGRKEGTELSISSRFGYTGYKAKSLNRLLSLEYDRQTKDGTQIFKCWLEDNADKRRVPNELTVPIRITHHGKSYEYSLTVQNAREVKIQPSIVFAGRDKKSGSAAEFSILVGAWKGHADLTHKIIEPSTGLKLREIDRKALSSGSIFEKFSFVIEGDLENVDDVTVACFRSKEVVGTCQVFINGRSDVAQAKLREINRERNRQLVEQGEASALDPEE